MSQTFAESAGRNTANSAHLSPRAWQPALILAISYLLLSIAWAFSNPGWASPDENDHLIKSLGHAQFQIGRPVEPLADASSATVLERQYNAISRYFKIPSKLYLDFDGDYPCFVKEPNVTATCLPNGHPPDVGMIEVSTPLGDYPPFLYTIIGTATLQADTPYTAILAGRLMVALMSSSLLFLGAWHLTRWLGKRGLISIAMAITPLSVFLFGSLTLSAIEIAAAVAMAAIVAVAAVRPESVLRSATHWALAISGSVLISSRHMGLIAAGLMIIALLVFTGWQRIQELLASRQLSFWVAVGTMGASTVAMIWWQLKFSVPLDNPFSLAMNDLVAFAQGTPRVTEMAIGAFGWLDVVLPGAFIIAWMFLWSVVLGLAVLIAAKRDAIVLMTSMIFMIFLAYYFWVTIFMPIGSGIQGRHFLSIAAFIILFAGVIVMEKTQGEWAAITRRLTLSIAIFVPFIHFFSIYYNAHRYAVTVDGPWWFVTVAKWNPPFGFVPWLTLGFLGAVMLGFLFTTSSKADSPTEA